MIGLHLSKQLLEAASKRARLHNITTQEFIRDCVRNEVGLTGDKKEAKRKPNRQPVKWYDMTVQFQVPSDLAAVIRFNRTRKDRSAAARNALTKGLRITATMEKLRRPSMYSKDWVRLGVKLEGRLMTIVDKAALKHGLTARDLLTISFIEGMKS